MYLDEFDNNALLELFEGGTGEYPSPAINAELQRCGQVISDNCLTGENLSYWFVRCGILRKELEGLNQIDLSD